MSSVQQRKGKCKRKTSLGRERRINVIVRLFDVGRKGQHKMSSFGLVCDLRPGYQGEWLQNIIINEKWENRLGWGWGRKIGFVLG